MYREIIYSLRERAKKDPRKIVFPEISDERVERAVRIIEAEGIAEPVILPEGGLEQCERDIFASSLYEWNRWKGMTFEEAIALMKDKLFCAAMMTRLGFADGFVAGASHSTADVLRAAIKCLDLDERIGLITSCFLMGIPNCQYGENGIFVFADCAVIPSPTSEQLAQIAVASALFVEGVLDMTPRVAMLSFSSKGSARNPKVDKVREAVSILRQRTENIFDVDGELQADSAIVPEVAARKLKGSDVAGKANILVFPDLDAGNIAYKLAERLALGRAIGPSILGTVQPCSDLSRGCSVEDIVDSTAITVVRAQLRETVNRPPVDFERYYAHACV